jgi:hypothetical protein
VAFFEGQEIGHRSLVLGHNAKTWDAAFQALVLAADLAKDTLPNFPSLFVSIFTADPVVLSYCQITERHDNAASCQALYDLIASTLFAHPDISISLQWIPGKASILPLKQIQDIAVEAATAAQGQVALTAPSIPVLRDIARHEASSTWEQDWLDSPHCASVFKALIHRPTSGFHTGYR